MHLVNIFTVNMNKVVIRKGLFETSSSSEDSLSVYQDMKLYVLPKDVYNRFVDGEVYVRFGYGIHPEWTDDVNYVNKTNAEPMKKYNLVRPNDGGLIRGYIFHYTQYLYISYSTYWDELNYHYSEFEWFDYEDGDNIIFGYYGYTED